MGKTMLAIDPATVLAERRRGLRIDADPQGFALGWRARPQLPAGSPVVGSPKPTLHLDTSELGENRDRALIAGPPRRTALSRSAGAASDLVLIPGQPSPFDLWAARDLPDILEECSVVRPGLRARLVVIRVFARTRTAAELREALADLPIAALRTTIRKRTDCLPQVGAGAHAAPNRPETRVVGTAQVQALARPSAGRHTGYDA